MYPIECNKFMRGRAAVAVAFLISLVVAGPATAQGFDPRFNTPVYRGDVGHPIFTDPSFVRMELGMTQRCATPGCVASVLPTNDYASIDFGTVGIGPPIRATTTPSFMANFFDGNLDALSSPGTHYNTLNPGTITRIAHPNSLLFNAPTGVSAAVPPPVQPATSRFGSGSVTISPATVAGTLNDKKTGLPTVGASFSVSTFEETYAIQAGINRSFNGTLAFDTLLPKLASGTPGAAAVALTTRMILSPGTLIANSSGIGFFDGNCLTLGTIGASVSEGTSDGRDNGNLGPNENFFGNADVGFVVPGFSSTIFDGAVNISSQTIGTDEKYHVAGDWNTPEFQLSNFASLPIKVTFIHTLTMIADPGADVGLVPLTLADLATLPQLQGISVIASGIAVPEPASAALVSCGALIVGAFSVRRRKGVHLGACVTLASQD